jgi:hypothetical protein
MRRMLLAGALLAGLPTEGRTQAAETRAARSFTTTAGYSWHASRGPRWGSIVNRRLYLVGLGRDRQLKHGNGWELRGTFEIPLAMVQRTSDRTEYCYNTPRPPGGWLCEDDRSDAIALGIGVIPLGLHWQSDVPGAAQFHFRVAGGILAFSNPTPVIQSTRANFVLEAGGGLTFQRALGREVMIGYKLHHISNAGFGNKNPGLDSNVLYVSLRRRPPNRSGDAVN